MDDLDSVLTGLDRPVKHQFLAVHLHGSKARAIVAGDHLDQRGLAGAVVAHKADHLACFQRKRNVADRLDGAKML